MPRKHDDTERVDLRAHFGLGDSETDLDKTREITELVDKKPLVPPELIDHLKNARVLDGLW